MRRKLLETNNFIDLYMHMVGKSEVPTDYHRWSCISLIAACVADRVWLEKFKGKKLAPNLYTVLIGPSGDGKNVAIENALDFIKDLKIVNMYRGKASGQYLIEHLGRRRKMPDGSQILENAKLYLATPELSMSVGSGQLADDFIKIMTELYGGGDYLFQFGTRMYGNVTVRGHTINWIGGSTKEWFIDALTPANIKSGAPARMVLVKAEADPSVRYTEPIPPPDYEEVREHLQARVLLLTQLEDGQFEKSADARREEDEWYHSETRVPPADEYLRPTWKRQHDLVLKLAMIYCLADGGDLYIRRRHMQDAIRMSYTAQKGLPDIVALAAIPAEHGGYLWVRDMIKRRGGIQRTALSSRAGRRGIMASRLNEYIRTLKEEGSIAEVRKGPRSARWYLWKGRRFPVEIEEEPENGSDDES